MTRVYTRPQIAQVIHPKEVIAAMERAFVAYSNGDAVIPPVGQLDFENPPGDCHIKYGYLKQGSTFTVKIATGFWKNPERGLASSNGVVLVFSSETGELLTIFQDEGFLTDMRTAAGRRQTKARAFSARVSFDAELRALSPPVSSLPFLS